METIRITFAELRAISVAVTELIQRECGVEMPASFNASIESDLGITGADAIDLMEKIGDAFEVDLRDFQPQQYFYPEPSGPNIFIFVLSFLVVAILALRLCIAVFIYPVFSKKGREMGQNSLVQAGSDLDELFQVDSDRMVVKDLKVSDLIASVVKGKFTHRQAVNFELEKG